jgi:hypothetical protein
MGEQIHLIHLVQAGDSGVDRHDGEDNHDKKRISRIIVPVVTRLSSCPWKRFSQYGGMVSAQFLVSFAAASPGENPLNAARLSGRYG